MLTAILATVLQIASGDIPIAQAEALARRDEASLPEGRSSELVDKQRSVLGEALVNCGVTQAPEAAGLMLVMKLDGQGRITRTWLNEPSVLGRCFEKEVRTHAFPTDGRPEFYTFINFNP